MTNGQRLDIARRYEALRGVQQEVKAAIVESVLRDGIGSRQVARDLGVSHSYVMQVVKPYR